MNKYVLIAMPIILIAGCAPSKYQLQMQQFEQEKMACQSSPVPPLKPLAPGAQFTMERWSGCVPIERGTYEGVAYRINHGSGRAEFGDSSGGGWVVTCKTDPVTDKVSAQIAKGNLMVYRSDGFEAVGVISRSYPGTPQTVRIDDHAAVVVSENERPHLQNSQLVLSQLETGKKMLVRYVDWPYGVNRDTELEVSGFNQAYEYARRCVP